MEAQQRSTGAPPSALPEGVTGARNVMSLAAAENFPVALRLLPRQVRDDLYAIYGFARLADDIGDRFAGDRLAALDRLEHELEAAADGRASHPLVRPLTPVIRRHGLDLGPFRDLIEANRRDQTQHRYTTFAELRDYCRLSARPVGRLVLGVFAISDRRALSLSDDVCDGLQVVEHLQDAGEDAASGRIYLPTDDLAANGCGDDDLRRPAAGVGLRRVIALQAVRARTLLDAGQDLVTLLPLWPRLAVAGYTAGGLGALDAIERAGCDVLSQRCEPSSRGVALHAAGLLRHSFGRRAHAARVAA